MLSQLWDLTSDYVPNLILAPFKRIKKQYDNLKYGNKIFNSRFRLCAQAVGGFVIGSVSFLPAIRDVILGLLNSSLESNIGCVIILHGGFFLIGVNVFDQIAKRSLQYYHDRYYNITNPNYIDMDPAQYELLQKAWNIPKKLARNIFDYLTDEILDAKDKKKAAKKKNKNFVIKKEEHRRTTYKSVLEEFRNAGDPDGSLDSLFTRFRDDEAAALDKIQMIEKDIEDALASVHEQKAPSEVKISIDEEEPRKSLPNNKRGYGLVSSWKIEELEESKERVLLIQRLRKDLIKPRVMIRQNSELRALEMALRR